MLNAAAHLAEAGKTILLRGDLAVATSDTLAASIWVEKGKEVTSSLSPLVQTRQTLAVWFQPSGVLYAALAVLAITLITLILHIITNFSKKNMDK